MFFLVCWAMDFLWKFVWLYIPKFFRSQSDMPGGPIPSSKNPSGMHKNHWLRHAFFLQDVASICLSFLGTDAIFNHRSPSGMTVEWLISICKHLPFSVAIKERVPFFANCTCVVHCSPEPPSWKKNMQTIPDQCESPSQTKLPMK